MATPTREPLRPRSEPREPAPMRSAREEHAPAPARNRWVFDLAGWLPTNTHDEFVLA